MSTANSPPGTGRRSACWPIHDTIRSAVTRCANTTSGGASMSIEVEKSAIATPTWTRPACVSFCRTLQPGEVRRPEPVEEVPHRSEPVGANHERMTGAVAPLRDQARTAKDPQMMGDDLLGDPELLRDLADGEGMIANPSEDAAPGAVRQRLQRSVNRLGLARHALIQAGICTNVNLWIGGADESPLKLGSPWPRAERSSSWLICSESSPGTQASHHPNWSS